MIELLWTIAFAVLHIVGPMIGLEYNGEAVCDTCRDVLDHTLNEWRKLVYVSPNPSAAAQQIEAFYSVADMLMSVWLNCRFCLFHACSP